MVNKRIKLLKQYRNILVEIKRQELQMKLDNEIERKIPTYEKSKNKVKILKLFK